MARIKESFIDEYEEFYDEVIEPQETNANIPNGDSETIFGKYYGDNEPAF